MFNSGLQVFSFKHLKSSVFCFVNCYVNLCKLLFSICGFSALDLFSLVMMYAVKIFFEFILSSIHWLLKFVNLCIWEVFKCGKFSDIISSHIYFFSSFNLFLLSFQYSNYIYIFNLLNFSTSFETVIFYFNLFFSLFFKLNNFYWTIFSLTSIFTIISIYNRVKPVSLLFRKLHIFVLKFLFFSGFYYLDEIYFHSFQVCSFFYRIIIISDFKFYLLIPTSSSSKD